MVRKRQSGQADPYQPVIRNHLVHEIQRHHGAVVQVPVPFAQRSGREILLLCQGADGAHQLRVIFLPEFHSRRAEAPEIPGSVFPGGNMEIIRVHHSMRAGHDNRLRPDFGDLRRHRPVRGNGLFNLFFTSAPHLRNDHRRMRNHICGSNRHADPSLASRQSLVFFLR